MRADRYDIAGRLTSMTPGLGSGTPSYVYGYAGVAVVQANVLSGTSWVPAQAFGYDQQRSVSTVGQYSAAGTQISTTVCLVHDALGRLTAVGLAKAVLPGPGASYCQSENDIMSFTAHFEYDAMNRRVARQDGPIWTEYVHDPGGNLLAELTRPATSGGTWTTNREYAWLDGQPLAQLEYLQSRAAPYLYYFHLDHLGQPRALTNETGSTTVWSAIPARPYGDVAETTTADPLTGKTVVTNLRLPGQYDERLLGSVGIQGPYYNWNRWYLPTLGRYMELDPIAAGGGFNGFYGPNWYGYAEGNPLRWTDPIGLKGGDHPAEGPCIAAGNNPLACRQVPPNDVPPRKFDLDCWADCYTSTRTFCKAPRWLSSGLLARLGVQILAPEVGYPLWVLCEVIDGEACESKCAIKPPEPPRPTQPPVCGK